MSYIFMGALESVPYFFAQRMSVLKKLLPFLMLAILAFWAVPVLAADSSIIIDGVELDAVSHGELLPLRDIVEAIGGTVSWNSHTRQVTIRRGRLTLTVSPEIINARAVVSRDFFGDYMGLGVGHINDTFIISTAPATRIAALVYHHILPDEKNEDFLNNPWTISTENFSEQMGYLRDNGFYTPTLDELEAFLYLGRPLPANSVMIHFDDGYYSNYVYALPILRQHGLRAVLFPITGDASALGDVQPALNYARLTRAAAITLRSGLDVFETASHSHALHDRAPDSTDTLLVTETRKNIIEDTLLSFKYLSNHRAYAYPLGMFNDYVIEALQGAGITMGFTVDSGYITSSSDPFRLGRFTIYQDTAMLRFRNIVRGRI